MFARLGEALRRFMYGRYGTDQLGLTLLIFGLVLSVLGGLFSGLLVLVSYVVLIYYIFRIFSRNIPARRRENAWFLRVLAPLRDRAHRYYRCPSCRKTVRVPRGKGKIIISCPSCGTRFEKRV